MQPITRWLEVLGYSQARHGLHLDPSAIDFGHRYRSELQELLRPDGQVRAKAVFEVDGVPAVAFLDNASELSDHELNRVRQKIWNQNLVSIMIVVDDNALTAYPTTEKVREGKSLTIDEAVATGHFSLADVASSDVQRRLPAWFVPADRVDRQLLRNLGLAIEQLARTGLHKTVARELLGQILFISCLEHRHIVSGAYRRQRRLKPLRSSIAHHDVAGIESLIACLRKDFNGDFLALDHARPNGWWRVGLRGLDTIGRFLDHVDLENGQPSRWRYDFSLIPVELLSGIWESLIDHRQGALSACYMPRHLANFVIDEAFHSSADPGNETIFDPACGCGVLLTTAFRRLLRIREGMAGQRLDLASRIELLQRHIFGADASEAACRMTAGSLYLALLEDLDPSDIALLQESEKVELPALRGHNLLCGETEGDYFAPHNRFAAAQRFSLVVCNPPWREPGSGDWSTVDAWAETKGVPRARRQPAGDFAFRALESVTPGGRVCLVMPISLLVASTSQPFVRGWLARARLERFVNFGDLHNFVFETAETPCGVITTRPRPPSEVGSIPADELIEYWAPKVDAGLAFGRLVLSAIDHHRVPAQDYSTDPTRLVTLMWGNEFDLALSERLKSMSVLEHMFTRDAGGWRARKGVNLNARYAMSESSAHRLKTIAHVDLDWLKRSPAVLPDACLTAFPPEIDSVANLTDDLWAAFHGPRILVAGEFGSRRRIRAAYVEKPASFKNNVGVICGPAQDRELLRFVAAYLCSSLASYFLLMREFKVIFDLHRVTLADLQQLPFVPPADHPEPERARQIVAAVSELLETQREDGHPQPQDSHARIKAQIDALIHEYFGLNADEIVLVAEADTSLLPSVRAGGYKFINTMASRPVDAEGLQAYVQTLRSELAAALKQHPGGTGGVMVQAWTIGTSIGRATAVAVSLASTTRHAGFDEEKIERWVLDLTRGLSSQHLLRAHRSDNVAFVPDVTVDARGAFLLVRPSIKRMWLRRSAMRDARSIVERIQCEGQRFAR